MSSEGESAYRQAYPKELDDAEKSFVEESRKGRSTEERPLGPVAGISACTGIGLSGGGIRSATFCLGVFQGLARHKLLRKIDVMSTVSGGGYFGSFYTRLLLRKEVAAFSDMEEALAPGSTQCQPRFTPRASYLTEVIT